MYEARKRNNFIHVVNKFFVKMVVYPRGCTPTEISMELKT